MADPSPKVSVLWVCALHGLDPAQHFRDGGDADPAPEAPPREEDPDVGEAGQPSWIPGLPGLNCHIKGAVGFQEFGAGSRARPGFF